MKDLPHHIKKLNRKVLRSMHREEAEMPEIPTWPESEKQKKKKAKIKMKKETLSRPSSDKSPEQRNKEMKRGRVPIFEKESHEKTKLTRPTRKKTPKL
jgi:hypothetical protein